MIEVKRAILHILDLNAGVPVYSDNDLDREIFDYLLKHLEKASRDAAAHTSKLGEVNPVRQQLERYLDNPDVFAQVTRISLPFVTSVVPPVTCDVINLTSV